MLDLDRFFADCQAAVAADPSHRLVKDVVELADHIGMRAETYGFQDIQRFRSLRDVTFGAAPHEEIAAILRAHRQRNIL